MSLRDCFPLSLCPPSAGLTSSASAESPLEAILCETCNFR